MNNEPEDTEADQEYEKIQDYMDSRRKRLNPRTPKMPNKRKEVTAGEILSELKPTLATVTDGNL